MTPAARVAAAIGVLDAVAGGAPVEKVLTNWARASRFAGSGDRAAVRDLVFDALRCRRSYGALGGGTGGRAIMIGALRASGTPVDAIFTGTGHAPAALSVAERDHLSRPAHLSELERLDCPDWLSGPLRDSLGEDFAPVMTTLQRRAPVFLRVNIARTTGEEMQAALGAEGIVTCPVAGVKTALEVTENAKKVHLSQPYLSGLVELQDAASQAVAAALPLGGGRVLDYCAGGGGKTLALAARAAASGMGHARFRAHDIAPGRMRDLPERARRAGVTVDLIPTSEIAAVAPFDLVLLDVPCSGSGSWRRAPQGKWSLTRQRLADLVKIQSEILEKTYEFVSDGGVLAYVTCSILTVENRAQIESFLTRHPGWRLRESRALVPSGAGDGFFLALLERN